MPINVPSNSQAVFHASLAIFGSALIPTDEIEVGTAYPSHLALVQDVLQKAITALRLLDTNNALLDQCVEYLRQLLNLTYTSGKFMSLRTKRWNRRRDMLTLSC